MKYTVVIQQPVPQEARADLEQQLAAELSLDAAKASKLASRRSGRLLKPTTRGKAEKLRDIFVAAGASVLLEEVPEEGGESAGEGGRPLGSAAPAAGQGAAVPVSLSADPFADPFAAAFGGAVADPFAEGGFGGLDPFGETTQQVLSAAPGKVTAASSALAAPADDGWASFAQGLAASSESGSSASSAAATAENTEDVWADFADSLRVDVPEQKRTEAVAAPLVPSFMDEMGSEPLAAEVAEQRGPRRSLERQVLQAALLPPIGLVLSTLLLIGILATNHEQNRMEDQANTLAQVLSQTLENGDVAGQLSALAADKGIGFVQVQQPGSDLSFVAGKAAKDSAALQNDYNDWQKNKTSSAFSSGGENYVVGRAGTGVTQVVVGVPNNFNIVRLLLPWLLVSVLLLGLSVLWARRAAQSILDPLQRLLRAADNISAGDLTKPVQAEANDEIGDLAAALERMRVSLSAALDRLRRRKR